MQDFWSRIERKPSVVLFLLCLIGAQIVLWTSRFDSDAHRVGLLVNAVALIALVLSRPQPREVRDEGTTTRATD